MYIEMTKEERELYIETIESVSLATGLSYNTIELSVLKVLSIFQGDTIDVRSFSECIEELQERRYSDAELAGTNSCVDNERRSLLFLKHRDIARRLQEKWVVHSGKRREVRNFLHMFKGRK